jgi:hypothetical protein
MYDWIIEADIHRLNKVARRAGNSHERRALGKLAQMKAQLLAERRPVSARLSGLSLWTT